MKEQATWHRGTKYWLGMLAAFTSVLALIGPAATPAQAATLTRDQVVKAMMPGWNLGNTLDAVPTEGSWNNPPVVASTFDDVKKAGFHSVRIPVTWDSHIGVAPDYTVDPVWMARVEEVVNFALDRDLYVMINMHHDSWLWVNKMGTDPTLTEDKFDKVWAQIAARFKNASSKLLFETINEPYGMTADQMNALNNDVVRITRASGGANARRMVVVGWTTETGFVMPNDPNTILTFHYYSPWDFVADWWGHTTWGTDADKQAMVAEVKRIHDTYQVPTIIGEYGLYSQVYRPSQWVWLDELNKAALKYDMATMWWDNGGALNRAAHTWTDPVQPSIIVHAAKGESNSYVVPGILYVKSDTAISDTTVQLQLNGNTLKHIAVGSAKLKRGASRDYTVSGDVVTLKTTKLASLLTPGKLGLNSQLTFSFSQGADQIVDLIQYKQPVLSQTTITIDPTKPLSDISIPIQLNGTQPATATAVEVATGNPIKEGKAHINLYDFWWDDTNMYLSSQWLLPKITKDTLITFEFWPQGVTAQLTVKVQTP
jgi:endoglucanase